MSNYIRQGERLVCSSCERDISESHKKHCPLDLS